MVSCVCVQHIYRPQIILQNNTNIGIYQYAKCLVYETFQYTEEFNIHKMCDSKTIPQYTTSSRRDWSVCVANRVCKGSPLKLIKYKIEKVNTES